MKNYLVIVFVLFSVSSVYGQIGLQVDNSEITDYPSEKKSPDFTFLMWDRNDNGEGAFTSATRPMFFYWDHDDSRLGYLIDTRNMHYLKSKFYSLDLTNNATIDGKVGIGMDPSASILSLAGTDDYYNPDVLIDGNNALISLEPNANGPHGLLFGDYNGGGLQLVYRTTPNQLIVERANDGGDGEDLFSIDYDTKEAYFNSNVGIGKTNPSEKLEVNGTIRSKEVKVEATPWPDYVFASDYDLKSLAETKGYIDEHSHLPGMPSAKEVEENGIALGEMNAKLLEKIEELTLLLIEKDQQMKDLIKRVEKLESR